MLLVGAAAATAAFAQPPAQPVVGPAQAAGQPTQRPAEPAPATPPDFPGAALFNSHPAFLVGVKVNHPGLEFHEGDSLIVTCTAERDAHLYLIYHQADGTSRLLFPNEARPESRIAAGQPLMVPPPGGDFRFRVRPPLGREVLQVVATLKAAPELEALVAKTGRAPPVSGEVLARLCQRLKADPDAWSEHRVPIATLAREEMPPAGNPDRAGLFIGVNRQKIGHETWIRFKLGAEQMAKVMAERGKVDPQRSRVLVDDEASRANIEQAVTRWLPSVSRPGDTVFIFYCGHGGTLHNLDGSRPDGRDGVLTTYDNDFQNRRLSPSEWEAGCRQAFITDTALARWLQELSGRQVAMLISSCHSGSMLDEKVLAQFLAREAARVKGISQLNVAVVASSLPDETTLSPLDKPVWLSQFLAEAMTQLPRPVTLEQAFDYYREKHKARLERSGTAGWHEPVFTNNALVPIVLAP
jgi:hypothetical protein